MLESEQIEWLLKAIDQWWDDFENMPPGLKDIELDKWIQDEKRKDILVGILQDAERNEHEMLRPEIKKIVSILND